MEQSMTHGLRSFSTRHTRFLTISGEKCSDGPPLGRVKFQSSREENLIRTRVGHPQDHPFAETRGYETWNSRTTARLHSLRGRFETSSQ